MVNGLAATQHITPSGRFAANSDTYGGRVLSAAQPDSYTGSRKHKKDDTEKKFLWVFPHPGEWLKSALSHLNPITIVKNKIDESISKWENNFSNDIDENIRRTVASVLRSFIK
jgi:hypothetical protein